MRAWSKDIVMLTPENSYLLSGDIEMDSIKPAIEKISKLDRALPASENLYLILDTPGGSVFAGLRLIEFLQVLDRKIVTITITAASMGFIIAQSLGPRLALASTIMLAHHGSSGCGGQFNEIEECLARLADVNKMMDIIASKRLNMSLEKYSAFLDRDRYFVGDKLLSENVVDKIVSIKCSPDLIVAKAWSYLASPMGLLQQERSACPLFL